MRSFAKTPALVAGAVSLMLSFAASPTHAGQTVIQIAGISSAYPKSDTLTFNFDDGAQISSPPYFLNSFAASRSSGGYSGYLSSSVSSYSGKAYIQFLDGGFEIFQEGCGSLVATCYVASIRPTNYITSSINPLASGMLGAYLNENLKKIDELVGPNGGWGVSFYTLPSFSESFPLYQVARTSSIVVSSVPEISSAALAMAALGFLSLIRRRAQK